MFFFKYDIHNTEEADWCLAESILYEDTWECEVEDCVSIGISSNLSIYTIFFLRDFFRPFTNLQIIKLEITKFTKAK